MPTIATSAGLIFPAATCPGAVLCNNVCRVISSSNRASRFSAKKLASQASPASRRTVCCSISSKACSRAVRASAASARAARLARLGTSCIQPICRCVKSSRVRLPRLGPVTGRLSMPSVSFGSGSCAALVCSACAPCTLALRACSCGARCSAAFSASLNAIPCADAREETAKSAARPATVKRCNTCFMSCTDPMGREGFFSIAISFVCCVRRGTTQSNCRRAGACLIREGSPAYRPATLLSAKAQPGSGRSPEVRKRTSGVGVRKWGA